MCLKRWPFSYIFHVCSVAAHARALVAGSQTTEPWNDDAMAHEAKCEAALILEASAKKQTKRPDASPADEAGLESESKVEATATRASKRQRKEVDYVALAAELKQQEKS